MPKFYYSPRAEKEMSEFVRYNHLKFTLNYLNVMCDPNRIALIDNILCMMPEKNVRKIMTAISKIAKAYSPAVKPDDGEDDSLFFDEFDEKEQMAGLEHYNECIDFLSKHWENVKLAKITEGILEAARNELEILSKKLTDDDFFYKRITLLEKFFSLGKDDIEIFLVLYFGCKNTDFEHMCDISHIEMSAHRSDMRGKIVHIRKFTGLNEMIVRRALSNDGPLLKYCIIDKDLDINKHIVDYLDGLNNEPLSSQFFTKFNGEAVPLEYHFSVKKHVDTIEKIIRNRGEKECVNILLYGVPGTGKTEFCRSLGKHLELDIYDINKIENDERPGFGSRFRFSALKVCQNTMNSAKSIVVIDEADEMLNGGSTASFFPFFKGASRNTEKDLINDFLDNSAGVYFWVTNHYANIEESTRRRFDYSIEFRKFTLAQRKQLWHTCIAKHGLIDHFTSEELSSLAKKYEINAGGIDIALRNYKRMTKGQSEVPGTERKTEIIDAILAPHISLIGGKAKQGANDPVAEYSLEGLNIKGDHSIRETLEVMRNFSKHLDENDKKPTVRNMNLLLHGPPGTGKTEFAKFAAAELGRTLISRKGSDLLSMWVGGTEQQIREAFKEAEHEGGILFVDEADGLIHERTGAQRSWEVTQVNEFLSNMEEFRGILICATNFKKNMDSASIRRFNLKVEFDYLDADGKVIFFDRILKPLTAKSITKVEKEELLKIEFLTPGDFKVVKQKNGFLPKSKITNETIINELRDEVAAKNNIKTNKIGF